MIKKTAGLVLLAFILFSSFGAAQETCKGMTWRVIRFSGSNVLVGKDEQTDPYNGDTSIDHKLPILAIKKMGFQRPQGVEYKYSYYVGWCRGILKLTPPVAGTRLTSLKEANRIVKSHLGDDYQMAEFHDGGGGWSFWGSGRLYTNSRFWVCINDQYANPWNSCEKTKSRGNIERKIAPSKPLKSSPNDGSLNERALIKQVEKELGKVEIYCINKKEQVTSIKLILKEEKNLDLLRRFKHLEDFHIKVEHFIDLSTLEALSNLTSLHIFNMKTENFSTLSRFPNLKKLIIKHSPINDISALKDLDSLEHLTLERIKIKDISPLKKLKNLNYLNIYDSYVSDIQPLAHLKGLKTLNLIKNLVKDISPCSGLTQLEELDLSQSRITDIEALRNLQELKKLILTSVRIEDISPVENLVNLEKLDLSMSCVRDMYPIGYLKNLKFLSIMGTKIKNIEAVEGLTLLESFNMFRTEIEDISAVKNLEKLRYLNIGESRVRDLRPVSNLLNLQEFWMMKTPVYNISPLKMLSKLKQWLVSGSRISKLPFWIGDWNPTLKLHHILKDCPLTDPPYAVVSLGRQAIREYFEQRYPTSPCGQDERIFLDRLEILIGRKMIQRPLKELRGYLSAYTLDEQNRVIGLSLEDAGIEDLSILREFKHLQLLDCSSNKVTDISSLSQLKKLEVLDLDFNRIRDILALKNLKKLRFVSLKNTWIEDIGPLRNARKMKNLYLSYNQIVDLTPLRKMTELETLMLRQNPVRDIGVLAKLKSLKYLNLDDTKVSDIRPIGNHLNLKSLHLLRTKIQDLQPLKMLINLEELDIAVAYPLDLNPICHLHKIRWLTVGDWPIENYHPMAKLKGLSQLDFYMGNLDYHMVWSIGERSKISSYSNPGSKNARAYYDRAQRIVNRYFKHRPEDRDYVPSGLMERVREAENINPQNDPELVTKYRRALNELKLIRQALEAHLLDHLKLPPGNGLDEIKKVLEPFYIKKMYLQDPWGQSYIYKKTGEKRYYIACGGSDGKFDGFREGSYIRIDGEDIVFANNKMIYGPKDE